MASAMNHASPSRWATCTSTDYTAPPPGRWGPGRDRNSRGHRPPGLRMVRDAEHGASCRPAASSTMSRSGTLVPTAVLEQAHLVVAVGVLDLAFAALMAAMRSAVPRRGSRAGTRGGHRKPAAVPPRPGPQRHPTAIPSQPPSATPMPVLHEQHGHLDRERLAPLLRRVVVAHQAPPTARSPPRPNPEHRPQADDIANPAEGAGAGRTRSADQAITVVPMARERFQRSAR